MNILDFITAVKIMRQAQKNYFQKGRLMVDLIKAKQAEALVDKALADGVVLRVTSTPPEPDLESSDAG